MDPGSDSGHSEVRSDRSLRQCGKPDGIHRWQATAPRLSGFIACDKSPTHIPLPLGPHGHADR